MEEDIYTPPKTELTEIVERVPRPKMAILAATTFNLLVSIALSITLGIAYGIYLAMQGATPEEIQVAALKLDSMNPFFLFSSFSGLLVSIISGYICAWLSIRNIYRNTAIVGILSIAIAFAINFAKSLAPVDLLISLLEFPALFLGAWLYARKQISS